ncbi:hypothetical protein J3Q64DRAFT_1847919 [Phycomyces blakesleeanus]|uniref:Uncharacterized protein n=1 Tax=Phycomyces blakesleeanus TaxID=4837 RepID=A0ABR3B3J8_PHYBL
MKFILSALSQKYQQLKTEGSDSNDNKYKVMKAMADQLGLPGTPAADILSHFGKPDELTPSLQQQGQAHIATMPGPAFDAATASALGGNQSNSSYYLVYYLKSKNEYLYFKVDSAKETVITSDWNLGQ